VKFLDEGKENLLFVALKLGGKDRQDFLRKSLILFTPGPAWGEKNGVKTPLLHPLKFPPDFVPFLSLLSFRE
jgi:hypothetical protein